MDNRPEASRGRQAAHPLPTQLPTPPAFAHKRHRPNQAATVYSDTDMPYTTSDIPYTSAYIRSCQALRGGRRPEGEPSAVRRMGGGRPAFPPIGAPAPAGRRRARGRRKRSRGARRTSPAGTPSDTPKRQAAQAAVSAVGAEPGTPAKRGHPGFRAGVQPESCGSVTEQSEPEAWPGPAKPGRVAQ